MLKYYCYFIVIFFLVVSTWYRILCTFSGNRLDFPKGFNFIEQT